MKSHPLLQFRALFQDKDRGAALIVSMGILAALSTMAITFVMLQRIESLAAANFAQGSKLKEINRSILLSAVDVIRHGSKRDDPSTTGYSATVDIIGVASQGYSDAWSNTSVNSYNYRTVTDVSIGDSVVQKLVTSIRIYDVTGQLYIGSTQPGADVANDPPDLTAAGLPANLDLMLEALLRFINSPDGANLTDTNIVFRMPEDDGDTSNFDDDVNTILKGGPYYSKDAVVDQLYADPTLTNVQQEAVRKAKFEYLRDYITVYTWNDTDRYDLELNTITDERAPININTAPKAVLVAILHPILRKDINRLNLKDLTAEKTLTDEILAARPFKTWQDFADFIRSDGNHADNAYALPGNSSYNLEDQMTASDYTVPNWHLDREALLNRLLSNLPATNAHIDPMPTPLSLKDTGGVTDTIKPIDDNSADDSGEGTPDEFNEGSFDPKAKQQTTELTLLGMGMYEIYAISRLYEDETKLFDNTDNDSDSLSDFFDPNEETVLSSYGSRMIVNVYNTWTQSLQEEFDNGSENDIDLYPQNKKFKDSGGTKLPVSKYNGWLALTSKIELPWSSPNSSDFWQAFYKDNLKAKDGSTKEPTINDLDYQTAIVNKDNTKPDVRRDGVVFVDQSNPTYTGLSFAQNVDNLDSTPGQGMVSMWVQKLEAFGTNAHYLLLIPFSDFAAHDGIDNNGVNGIDEGAEAFIRAQYLSLKIKNDTLIFSLQITVNETLWIAADADYGGDGLDNDNDGLIDALDTDGETVLYLPEGSNDEPLQATQDISAWNLREWHYIAIAWDVVTTPSSPVMNLYVDGTSSAPTSSLLIEMIPPGGYKGSEFYLGNHPPTTAIAPDNSPGGSSYTVDLGQSDKTYRMDEVRAEQGSVDPTAAPDKTFLEGTDGTIPLQRWGKKSSAGDTYVEGTFTSSEYPPKTGTESTQHSIFKIANAKMPQVYFDSNRLLPYGTELGMITWTQYLPDYDTQPLSSEKQPVSAVVELDNSDGDFSSTEKSQELTLDTLSKAARIYHETSGTIMTADKSDNGSGTRAGARIRYKLTLRNNSNWKKNVTPVVDDVTVVLFPRVTILEQSELDLSD